MEIAGEVILLSIITTEQGNHVIVRMLIVSTALFTSNKLLKTKAQVFDPQ